MVCRPLDKDKENLMKIMGKSDCVRTADHINVCTFQVREKKISNINKTRTNNLFMSHFVG